MAGKSIRRIYNEYGKYLHCWHTDLAGYIVSSWRIWLATTTTLNLAAFPDVHLCTRQ